jgi:hypothetical protein
MTPSKPAVPEPTRAELIEAHTKAAAQALEAVDLEGKRKEFQRASEEFENSLYNLNELYDDVDY